MCSLPATVAPAFSSCAPAADGCRRPASSRHLGVHRARLAIPQPPRPAVAAARAEDGLEGGELAAPAHHSFHVGEALEEQHRLVAAARNRPRLACPIDKQTHAGFVEVDPLEIAEVHRVRGRGPDAAEEVGIGLPATTDCSSRPTSGPSRSVPPAGPARNFFSMAGINSSTSALPQGPLLAESAKTWCPSRQSGSSTT